MASAVSLFALGNAQDTLCSDKMQSPADIVGFPVIEGTESKSMLAKHLTHDTWSTLKDRRDMYGFSFK